MLTKAKPQAADNEEQVYRQEVKRLKELLIARNEWALRNEDEVQNLRSLLIAATDQIQTLSSKLEAVAPGRLDQESTDSQLRLPTRSLSQYSWMQSIVEELAQAKQKADKSHQSMLQLEKDLKERTHWARSLDKVAKERTAWALAADQEVLKTRKVIDDLQQTNAELEERLKARQPEGLAMVPNMQLMQPLLAEYQHQFTASTPRAACNPGDSPTSFFSFALFMWRITWPIRFVYRVVRRFIARKLWNPLKWPAWVRRMRLIQAEHGIRGLVAVTAEISEQADHSGEFTDSVKAQKEHREGSKK